MAVVKLIDVGPHACLVEVDDAVAAASLAGWARQAGVEADDIVPAAATVLFDGVDPAAVRSALPHWPRSTGPGGGRVVRVPVVYDGADLEAVAGQWGCTVDEAPPGRPCALTSAAAPLSGPRGAAIGALVVLLGATRMESRDRRGPEEGAHAGRTDSAPSPGTDPAAAPAG